MSNNPPAETTPASFAPVKTHTRLRATYRVQLNPDFNFQSAAELAAYLGDLGISHLYCSPYLQSAPGSLHGYDVVNYHQVNQELGGEEGLVKLVEALRERGLSHILDMVPNHMAITGRENPWWWDVLENGPSSRYAVYFDVDWDTPEPRPNNQVLVPVLGDQYGRVLEACEIRLEFSGRKFRICYYENEFPVDPISVGSVLALAAARVIENSAVFPGEHSWYDQLSFLAGAFSRLPASTATDRDSARRRDNDKEVLYDLLERLCREHPQAKAALEEAVEAINADPDHLDVLLGLQNYRLAHWRITQRELGYRRFFDINNMIGLRMEDELVYLDTHARVLDWIASVDLDGLRIDHPDGLRDPLQYFQRLRSADPEAWIVIEKILEAEERLPDNWPVHGTTGYDFLNRVNGIQIDPLAEEPITHFYSQFTGTNFDYPALVLEKKLLAASDVLGSDLERLAVFFSRITERHRRYRDTTLDDLRAALAQVAACLPVYRTYIRPEDGQASERDAAYIEEAVAAAKAQRPDLDPFLFDFMTDLLLLRVRGELEDELVKRFQQLTGPLMAKGVEDTTFYIYNRFVSLNEVGGSPGRFGFSVAEFHNAAAETLARWPYSMLNTSTHDTKRSEDVRARLNVLSEIPEQWPRLCSVGRH